MSEIFLYFKIIKSIFLGVKIKFIKKYFCKKQSCKRTWTMKSFTWLATISLSQTAKRLQITCEKQIKMLFRFETEIISAVSCRTLTLSYLLLLVLLTKMK